MKEDEIWLCMPEHLIMTQGYDMQFYMVDNDREARQRDVRFYIMHQKVDFVIAFAGEGIVRIHTLNT